MGILFVIRKMTIKVTIQEILKKLCWARKAKKPERKSRVTFWG